MYFHKVLKSFPWGIKLKKAGTSCFEELWCPEEDSNFHELSPTST
jgi:hypothetical protein